MLALIPMFAVCLKLNFKPVQSGFPVLVQANNIWLLLFFLN
ncbi:hypothetical protein NTG1052_310015 [Candidatus Nitrotoga sp. 1052]|nr:hypothetical protein NTG1052_310015 [Candidatus Nitrotoga sp. 1052]